MGGERGSLLFMLSEYLLYKIDVKRRRFCYTYRAYTP